MGILVGFLWEKGGCCNSGTIPQLAGAASWQDCCLTQELLT